MKKKSILMRVGIVAAALTLATTGMTSGTLAKYTASASGYTSAILAKWKPVVSTVKDGTNLLGSDTVTEFEMQVADATTGTNKSNAGAYNDGTKQYVAPGLKGTTTIWLDAGDSDMDVKYEVKIVNWDATANSNAGGPKYFIPTQVQFALDGTTTTDIPSNPANEATSEVTVGSGYLPGAITRARDTTLDKFKKVELVWEWPYDGEGSNDEMDNGDMTAILAATGDRTKLGFDVVVTLTQATGTGNDKYTKPTT